jgi:hypothetical protein
MGFGKKVKRDRSGLIRNWRAPLRCALAAGARKEFVYIFPAVETAGYYQSSPVGDLGVQTFGVIVVIVGAQEKALPFGSALNVYDRHSRGRLCHTSIA